MRLSIVVPCYNEAKNIPLILEKFNQVILGQNVELILVDNGSTDDTKSVLSSLLPQFPFARSVTVVENKGYGFGIVSGLREAKGTYLGYTHADMQTDPADVIKALEIIEKQESPEECYVKGDRKGRPLFDQFFTIGMSAFESIYLRTKLWDINAQPNVFHRSFFERVSQSCPSDFSLDLYFLYMAKQSNIQVIRFDVVFPPRIHGESSWNTGLKSKWKFIKRAVNFSVKLKREL